MNASASQNAVPLPSVPSLEERHLRLEKVFIDQIGDLHAFRPASHEFHCADDKAPTLLLVPGLGMDAIGFIRQLPLGVASHLHLLQMASHKVKSESGLGCFAHLVEAYIKSRKLEQHPGGLVLGGCSMGGAVSLATAIRGKVNLRGLILLGTFAHCQHLPLWQRLAAPLARFLPLKMSRRAIRFMIAKTNHFGNISAEEADWLVSCTVDHTRDYFVRAVAALTRQNQLSEARLLKVPTLVVHGTHDYVLPYAAGKQLAEHIPGSRLVTIQGSGHAHFFTDHDQTNSAILEFLQSLPPRTQICP